MTSWSRCSGSPKPCGQLGDLLRRKISMTFLDQPQLRYDHEFTQSHIECDFVSLARSYHVRTKCRRRHCPPIRVSPIGGRSPLLQVAWIKPVFV